MNEVDEHGCQITPLDHPALGGCYGAEVMVLWSSVVGAGESWSMQIAPSGWQAQIERVERQSGGGVEASFEGGQIVWTADSEARGLMESEWEVTYSSPHAADVQVERYVVLVQGSEPEVVLESEGEVLEQDAPGSGAVESGDVQQALAPESEPEPQIGVGAAPSVLVEQPAAAASIPSRVETGAYGADNSRTTGASLALLALVPLAAALVRRSRA